MTRGTFANIRIRNLLAPGTEGGVTRHLPDGTVMPIYDAAMKYKAEGVPLVVLAGSEYGTGSSRDWAAKGAFLLGVRAVLAASFERIHRSNLVGMGVLPLEFDSGTTWQSLGLTGEETFDVSELNESLQPRQTITVVATGEDGRRKSSQCWSHRHASRARLLPQRRHFADGDAEVIEELVEFPRSSIMGQRSSVALLVCILSLLAITARAGTSASPVERRESLRHRGRSECRAGRGIHPPVAEELDSGAARHQAREPRQNHPQDERRPWAGRAGT